MMKWSRDWHYDLKLRQSFLGVFRRKYSKYSMLKFCVIRIFIYFTTESCNSTETLDQILINEIS